MDAFVNTVQQPETPELKKEINDVAPTSENVCEISAKEKQVTEAKPDTEVDKISQKQKIDDKLLLTNSEHVNDCTTTTNAQTPAIVVKIENKKNEETTIEDSNKSAGLTEKLTKDVVDHANVVTNILTEVEALVAQKNEENTKVSIINSSNDDKNIEDTSDSNEITNDTPKISPTVLKYTYSQDQWSPQNTSGKKIYDREFLMKLQDDPQSRVMPPNLPPMDFVQRTSNRQTSSSRNNTADSRNLFNRDSRAPDALFPGFAKPGLYNPKMQTLPGNKKSYQGNKKPNKPNVIHVSLSLHEDVKLRESENAWKPTRVKSDTISEDEAKTQALYKKVRSVLNKLTPQKFDTLVDQVKSLQIDTHERLQGVIDLVFQKAVDEPNFSVAYALMCKQLAQMQVAGGDNSSRSETKQEKDNKTNFRLLILTRCQHEFETNTVDEAERNRKLKEVDDCTDPEKKKELATALEDADRRLRMKSVGNIRFVGELFKQGMIKAHIMNRCIETLLESPDDENLECLSKLLTTIGQTFENGGGNLSGYFDKISQLSQQSKNDGSKKISSRIRFALRDLVDLRNAKWKPRRDAGNPKTMDQVVKDAESERLDIELNNTPRKDDRNLDRRRNRGGNSNMDDGWSTMPSKSTKMPYSVEASKLNTKIPTMEDIKLGVRNQFVWGVANIGKTNSLQVQQNKFAVLDPSGDQDKRSIQLPGSRSTGATRDYRPEYKTWDGGRGGSRNGSHQLHSSSSMSGRDSRESSMPETTSRSQSMSMPTPSMKYSAKRPTSAAAPVITKPILTETQLENEIRTVLDGCKTCANADAFIESAMDQLSDKLDNSTYPFFVSKSLNAILERTSNDRARYSALLAYMINNRMFPLSLLQSEYDAIWKEADDLSLDLPKFWTYAAEVLVVPVVRKAHPLVELKRTTSVLKSAGCVGKLVGELLTILAQSEGPKWLADKWTESGLQLSDLIDPSLENADDIIKKYNLGFLTNGGTIDESSPKLNLTFEEIHQQLLKLLREKSFDDITNWITEKIGNDRSKEPQFIRKLVTSILEVSISEPDNSSPVYKLESKTFINFLPLITRYVENEPQLELQCLYAINAYYHKLMYPQGVLGSIVEVLSDVGIISSEAFIAWQESKDPAEIQGHSIAVTQLTSFFVNLKEGIDEEEA